MDRQQARHDLIRRYRLAMGFFIVALVASGLTAFPLLHELDLLAGWLGLPAEANPAAYAGVRHWIALVREGLRVSYGAYPFLAYGTDWLAFAHLAIAVFFIGPFREPGRHDWILVSGMIACLGVLPLALIAGAWRGIPLYWRLIDCSFGIAGILPLWYCRRLGKQLGEELPA